MISSSYHHRLLCINYRKPNASGGYQEKAGEAERPQCGQEEEAEEHQAAGGAKASGEAATAQALARQILKHTLWYHTE